MLAVTGLIQGSYKCDQGLYYCYFYEGSIYVYVCCVLCAVELAPTPGDPLNE